MTSWLALLACTGSPPDAPTPVAMSVPVAQTGPAVQLSQAVVESSPASPLPATATDPGAAAYGLRGVDWACAVCQSLDLANLDEVQVSTFLQQDARYGGSKALDGQLATAWCEGVEGPGIGQTLRVRLRKPMLLNAVGMRGGYFKSEDLLAANGRVRAVRLTTSTGVDQVLRFADPAVPMRFDPSLGSASEAGPIPATEWFERAATGEMPRHAVQGGEDAPVEWLQLELLEVWPGSRYTDTCISEIELLVVDPADL